MEWAVMAGRGTAPWVQLNGGKVDVKYRTTEDQLPRADDLPVLWRNSYFLDALQTITFQLEQTNA